jgi:hypothetical protein
VVISIAGAWLTARLAPDTLRFAVDLDTRIKLAIYRLTADHGKPPAPQLVADLFELSEDALRQAYARLNQRRVLVLESNGLDIRMAPPFSGVPTQHRVRVAGTDYYANCAWDALGIPAALHQPGEVHSRCEQSQDALRLAVGPDGPEPSSWLFHCAVPAAEWWKDIVFT